MTTHKNESTPLPEAPASATMKVEYRGYEIMFTLRDHSGYTLIEKVEKAIDVLEGLGAKPAPQRSYGRKSDHPKAGTSTNGPANGNAPLCPTHQRPMKASQYGSGWYCATKIADDDGTGKPVYCKQKVK